MCKISILVFAFFIPISAVLAQYKGILDSNKVQIKGEEYYITLQKDKDKLISLVIDNEQSSIKFISDDNIMGGVINNLTLSLLNMETVYISRCELTLFSKKNLPVPVSYLINASGYSGLIESNAEYETFKNDVKTKIKKVCNPKQYDVIIELFRILPSILKTKSICEKSKRSFLWNEFYSEQ